MFLEFGQINKSRIISILSASLLQVLLFNSAFPQSSVLDKVISLEPGIRTIESLLQEIIDRDVNLSYNDNSLPLRKFVKIKTVSRTVHQHLITIFNDEKIAYEQSENTILLYKSLKKLRKKVTVRGVIKDRSTGESLIGAHIWIDSLDIGTTTNEYGFYSISIRQGDYRINSSYLGYETSSEELVLRKNRRINFDLNPQAPELKEVVISSQDQDYMLEFESTGHHKMDMITMGQIPYFLGEVDVLQGSLLLPGISNLGENAIGLNVRGGTIDQNLILLDEAPIYNSSHLFGLISVFNPDAVKQTEIYKSGIPVSYGGRASSVIHVRKREGNDQDFHITGGLGLASTRLMAEGPIVKDRSSFLISARSSFISFSNDINFRESRASFHDVNAKFNFRVNKRNTIYLSGYLGKDRNRIGEDQLRRWGNNTATFRWNSQITPKLFMNASAVFGDYSYKTGKPNKGIGQFIGTASNISYTVKSDFTYYKSPKNSFDFGGGLILHRIRPGDRIPNTGNQTFNEISLDSEHGLEPYFYFKNEQKLSDRITFNFGLRISQLLNIGPGDDFVYREGESRERQSIIDTIRYDSREVIKRYNGIEPRISLNYRLSSNSAIKLSYDRVIQYIHLISNTISPSPTDVWKLSGTHVSPQIGNQIAVGYLKQFAGNIELSVELFGKKMTDIIDYKDGADLLLNETIETELLSGEGKAYGMEFSLRKKLDRLSGWLSYTLSRSERRITGETPGESINNGDYYPNDFDQTHDLSLVGIYGLNERWSFSSNFVYRTGRPITFPESKYQFENSLIPNFTDRNQSRISDYHRLDLSATYHGKSETKKGRRRKVEDYWTFSLYNVYARRNAFSYFFRQSESNLQETEVVKYSILGTIIPSVTYNFRF